MDLSIIIVNWNSSELLSRCLESLYCADVGGEFEVIVVDNASYDGCDEMLQTKFSAVEFIQSQENLGFARANNLGASKAHGKVLLFLNPDTEIVGTALRTMMGVLETRPDAGIVGCRLLNEDRTLQTTCVLAYPRILNELVDSEALRRAFPNLSLWGTAALMEREPKTVPVECVSGACLMIRREAFDRVGEFTPHYFMYVEDRDLCYKVRKAGYKTYFTNTAEVIHYGGSSSESRAESHFSTVMRQQSLLIFMRERHGILHAAFYRLATFGAAAVRLFLLGAGRILAIGSHAAPARSSIKKWRRVLRWSVGLEPWAGQH